MADLTNIQGMLFGLAYGDALGAPTEFMTLDEIAERWPGGPSSLDQTGYTVTDDTQMMLAVGQGIVSAANEAPVLSPNTLEKSLRHEYVTWFLSPENNRAPGMACLSACERLEKGFIWTEASNRDSKGCGANMRVAPAAVLGDDLRAPVAQFQSALTHGHPTALAAADVTAEAMHQLSNGTPVDDLLDSLQDYAAAQREIYHTQWLDDLWQGPLVDTPEEFIRRGWDECRCILSHIQAALDDTQALTDKPDACSLVGEGWIAEEAFAAGLLSFLWFPNQPLRALNRAATSGGDSDSIACLAGAFAGAYLGIDAFPTDWKHDIEYAPQLTRLSEQLHQLSRKN